MVSKIIKVIIFIIMIILLFNSLIFFEQMKILNLFGITKSNNNLEYKNFIMKIPINLEKTANTEFSDGRMYIFDLINLEFSSPIYRNYYVNKMLNYIIYTSTFYYQLFVLGNNEISRINNYFDFSKNDIFGTKNMVHEKVYFLETKKEESFIVLSFSHSKRLSLAFDIYFSAIKQRDAFNKKGALSCDKSKNKCFSAYNFNKFNVKQITEIVDKKYFAYTFKIDYNLFIHVLYKKIDKEYDNKIYKGLLDSIFEASKKYNAKINKKDDKDLLKIGSDFWK